MIIGHDRLAITLEPAEHVAKRDMHQHDTRMALGKLGQNLDRGLGAARFLERLGPAQFGGIEGRIVIGHLQIGGCRQIELLLRLQQGRGQQHGIHVIGAQIFRDPGIQ